MNNQIRCDSRVLNDTTQALFSVQSCEEFFNFISRLVVAPAWKPRPFFFSAKIQTWHDLNASVCNWIDSCSSWPSWGSGTKRNQNQISPSLANPVSYANFTRVFAPAIQSLSRIEWKSNIQYCFLFLYFYGGFYKPGLPWPETRSRENRARAQHRMVIKSNTKMTLFTGALRFKTRFFGLNDPACLFNTSWLSPAH